MFQLGSYCIMFLVNRAITADNRVTKNNNFPHQYPCETINYVQHLQF